jgi:uncharacterized membrane protein
MSAPIPAIQRPAAGVVPGTAGAAAGISSGTRIRSIDLIRGVVMVLMAIDHVRVYAGVPAGGPDPAIFFTRWVTHFCAPAFVFLAGTSAFLYGRRHADLPRYLLTRGAWLVLLELTFLRAAWTFNFDFMQYEMAGVIWAIGWCMILMAALVRLPVKVVGWIGLIIVAGHNVMDPLMGSLVGSLEQSRLAGLWKILYVGFFAGPIRIGPDGPSLIVLYSIVPWIGVMAAGFAFGKVLLLPAQSRDRACLLLGLGAIGLFLLLRTVDLYGDPQHWRAAGDGARSMPALLAFLNTTKYPASLDFLLMTLGPAIALIPLAEKARGAVAGWIATLGRVPFFYYVLHIPLIHALAIGVSWIRLGEVSPWLFANHPMGAPRPPDGYMWSLPLLYVVWAAAVVVLYFACRWFAAVKARRHDWWLGYL